MARIYIAAWKSLPLLFAPPWLIILVYNVSGKQWGDLLRFFLVTGEVAFLIFVGGVVAGVFTNGWIVIFIRLFSPISHEDAGKLQLPFTTSKLNDLNADDYWTQSPPPRAWIRKWRLALFGWTAFWFKFLGSIVGILSLGLGSCLAGFKLAHSLFGVGAIAWIWVIFWGVVFLVLALGFFVSFGIAIYVLERKSIWD
jgi:hypothetical protein